MGGSEIAAGDETGTLGICYLKRLWSLALAERNGGAPGLQADWQYIRLLLDGLGLGLQQTLAYLYHEGPGFDEFEDWVRRTSGTPGPVRAARLNSALLGAPPPESVRQWLADVEAAEPVLSAEDLAFWEAHGYVVLQSAVEEAPRGAAEAAIWEAIGASPSDPESWYHRDRPGIMVEFIQHPALQANRLARRIHKAFAQLWGTPDLWVSADRCGFHPPQREDFPFPGPDLHWDIDLAAPPRRGTQGILYLTDTPAEQGALTLVPGFQHRLRDWLDALPAGADPADQDLHALGSTAVAGKAGDMVIWHPCLPHGSRPNRGSRPRIVQYINLHPAGGC